MMINYIYIDSNIGKIYVAGNDKRICRVGLNVSSKEEFVRDIQQRFNQDVCHGDSSDILSRFAMDMKKYLCGNRVIFNYDVDLTGATAFQIKVWEEVQKIPYGRTATYKEIAARIGKPHACRAVGQANGKNPMPLIIPCHRVIDTGGKLGGFSAGLRIKEYFLGLEQDKVTNTEEKGGRENGCLQEY